MAQKAPHLVQTGEDTGAYRSPRTVAMYIGNGPYITPGSWEEVCRQASSATINAGGGGSAVRSLP